MLTTPPSLSATTSQSTLPTHLPSHLETSAPNARAATLVVTATASVVDCNTITDSRIISIVSTHRNPMCTLSCLKRAILSAEHFRWGTIIEKVWVTDSGIPVFSVDF